MPRFTTQLSHRLVLIMTEGFYKTDTFKTSNDDTWTTPRDFYIKLDNEFGFGLDAAAMASSTLVEDNWFVS